MSTPGSPSLRTNGSPGLRAGNPMLAGATGACVGCCGEPCIHGETDHCCISRRMHPTQPEWGSFTGHPDQCISGILAESLNCCGTSFAFDATFFDEASYTDSEGSGVHTFRADLGAVFDAKDSCAWCVNDGPESESSGHMEWSYEVSPEGAASCQSSVFFDDEFNPLPLCTSEDNQDGNSGYCSPNPRFVATVMWNTWVDAHCSSCPCPPDTAWGATELDPYFGNDELPWVASCSGSRSGDFGGHSASMTWTSSATATGGTLGWTIDRDFGGGSTNSIVATASWAISSRAQCPLPGCDYDLPCGGDRLRSDEEGAMAMIASLNDAGTSGGILLPASGARPRPKRMAPTGGLVIPRRPRVRRPPAGIVIPRTRGGGRGCSGCGSGGRGGMSI